MAAAAESPAAGHPSVGSPAFGGPTASSWREQALTRIAELEDLAKVFISADPPADPAHPSARAILAASIARHLETAREAAGGTRDDGRGRMAMVRAMLGGSPLERTASNVDAAEADLLRIAPLDYVEGQLPGLLAHVRSHLEFHDPRRQEIEVLCRPGRTTELTPVQLNSVIAAVRAASSAARREIVQIRSFRNILYITALLLSLTAGGLVLLGILRPSLLPLCFHPGDAVVCPTHSEQLPQGADVDEAIRRAAGSWDLPLTALVGLIAAAISAAVALRNLRGTSTPYALPVALAVLKLPTGALTAILGMMLLRGGFVPGLSALDSTGQILAWAIVFGYAQQLFTRLVDERAHDVLNQVGGQEQPREAAGREIGRTGVKAPPKDQESGDES